MMMMMMIIIIIIIILRILSPQKLQDLIPLILQTHKLKSTGPIKKPARIHSYIYIYIYVYIRTYIHRCTGRRGLHTERNKYKKKKSYVRILTQHPSKIFVGFNNSAI